MKSREFSDEQKSLIESLDVGSWSFSDEREFIENLFVGRFGNFLLVFSLFLTAGFANSFSERRYLVFYIGAAVLAVMWLPLLRAYKKLDSVLKIIFREMPGHPARAIEEIMKLEGYKPWFPNTRFMGIFTPGICVLILLWIGVAVNFGLLE